MATKYLIIVFLACLSCKMARAQRKIFAFSAGYGLAYVTKHQLAPGYTPLPGIHINAALFIPVSEKIYVETGLGYRRKGFNSYKEVLTDDVEDYFYLRAKYHYLSLPLSVVYTVYRGRNSRFYAGGGVNYSFLVSAHTAIHEESYHKGQPYGSYDYVYKPRLGLVESDRHGIDLFIFDTGLKLQLGYVYRNRWLLQLFHEHSLYSFVANAHDGSSLKMRYTGLALGIILR